ncbi:MAG: efflux RND transporter periplasmic adaptor subunit [Bacteroidota bacterium]|nr:efflux RND transporter periplasmic adaptor subunit [Bacteroidota bacterium]MDP4234512.1 efflux RND transporter periplasmic adaptor subunit [Bacteroidota bacterium]MDP4242577.1 efflux RND transporter periplasmic adaptor subunit [Bacteroidota bacterium]MDP4288091.1 efflux RND transporter periplasmic adaptor subunit [Bacteroidota bacterium]
MAVSTKGRMDMPATVAAGPNGAAAPSTQTVLNQTLEARRKKRRRTRTILIVAGGLVLLMVIIALVTGGKEKPIAVQTEKVARHTITEVVQATGKIQPEVQVKVSPEVPGEIIELPFKEGDHVKKGDLLAKIKPTTFEDQYAGAEAQLNSAKAQSEQQRAAVIQANQDMTRGEKLLAQHLISEQDFDALKAKHDAAEAGMNSANFQAAAAASQMRQYKEALRKTSVLSPMNGVVTSLISQLGEKVVGTSSFAGTEMMTVSDLTVMNAMVDVDENDVVNIKLGDAVKISIDAFPNRIFTGKVLEIANSAKLTGAGSQDQSTNFTVKVRLDDFGAADLRPGMTCTARIETLTKENVLAVPMLSVTRRDNEDAKAADSMKKVRQANKGEFHEGDETPTIVFTVDKGVAKKVHVKTGVSDNAYVEILSGLQGGEEVVKGNFRAVSKDLDDGKKVKVDNSGKTVAE